MRSIKGSVKMRAATIRFTKKMKNKNLREMSRSILIRSLIIEGSLLETMPQGSYQTLP